MNRLELEKIVIERISQAGQAAGQKSEVTTKTVPLRDIEFFDSLTALEVCMEIEQILGIKIEDDLFFRCERKRRTDRSIGDVVAILYTKIATLEEQHVTR